jgi:hypothetical protein
VPNLRGKHDQEGRKEQEPKPEARGVERRKEAEPGSEKADDYGSRSDGADDSERESRSEIVGE